MPKAFCSNAGLPGSFTKALSYDEQIQFLIDKYNKMADVVNNLDIESKIEYVSYEPQRKTDVERQQATDNIGAVSTIANQILDEDEQMNARENINAMEYEPKDDFVKDGGAVVYDENFTEILPNTNIATIAYCEPGRYYCPDVTGITGFTAAMPFEMEVFKVNSNLIRRYFQYDNGRKYVQEVELNPLKFYAAVDFGGFNVSYLLQDLTEDQKAQARANIGAGTGSGGGSAENAVLYTEQELTDSEKTQARTNIYAKENKSDSDIIFDGKGIDLTRPQTIIPNGVDFNDATYCQAGVYYGNNGQNITNYPLNYRQPSFMMVVYNYTNKIIRYFYLLGEGARTMYQEITITDGTYNYGYWTKFPGDAVLTTEQYLNQGQKDQARLNIGAGTSNITTSDVDTEITNKAILYDTAQNLTEEQKTLARNNIDMGSENYIDNGNFTNLVNQRQNNSYTGNGKYCFDRWNMRGNVTCEKTNVGLKLSNTTTATFYGISQAIENPQNYLNKNLTLAVYFENITNGGFEIKVTDTTSVNNVGTILFTSGDSSNITTPGLHIVSGSIPASLTNNMLTIWICTHSANSTATIKYCALYEGIFTSSTLPLYKAKNFTEELNNCRRFYMEVRPGIGFVANAENAAYFNITSANQMRAIPSVEKYSATSLRCNGKNISNSSITSVTNSATYLLEPTAYVIGSGFTGLANHAIVFEGVIGFSADL